MTSASQASAIASRSQRVRSGAKNGNFTSLTFTHVVEINEYSCAPLETASTAIDGRDVDSVESLLRQGKQWEINAADLLIGDVIGKGFFGEVRRGAWKGVDVAVKCTLWSNASNVITLTRPF